MLELKNLKPNQCKNFLGFNNPNLEFDTEHTFSMNWNNHQWSVDKLFTKQNGEKTFFGWKVSKDGVVKWVVRMDSCAENPHANLKNGSVTFVDSDEKLTLWLSDGEVVFS